MYKELPDKKLNGQESFKNTKGKNFSVLEFWQYGYSSLYSNIIRGALAEFLVENALKDKKDISIRYTWDDYDVVTKGHKKIEVKCSAYIQDWEQEKLSTIKFSGFKSRSVYGSETKNRLRDYKADIYILVLFNHKEQLTLDILDMDQWSFYVLSRAKLKKITDNGNSISLIKLEKHKIKPCHFNDLKTYV